MTLYPPHTVMAAQAAIHDLPGCHRPNRVQHRASLKAVKATRYAGAQERDLDRFSLPRAPEPGRDEETAFQPNKETWKVSRTLNGRFEALCHNV